MDEPHIHPLISGFLGAMLGFIIGVVYAVFSARGLSFPPDGENLKIIFVFTASFTVLCYVFHKYWDAIFELIEPVIILVGRLFLR